MSSLNKCCFIGNLGRDPEVRRLNSGDSVVSFSLACSENWRDKQTGNRREKTEWINVVVFNQNLVKVVEQYLHKGDKIYIEGKWRTRKWQDKDGNDRYSTECFLENFGGILVMLSTKRDGDENRGAKEDTSSGFSGDEYGKEGFGGGAGRRIPSSGGGSLANDLDDDIPFAAEFR